MRNHPIMRFLDAVMKNRVHYPDFENDLLVEWQAQKKASKKVQVTTSDASGPGVQAKTDFPWDAANDVLANVDGDEAWNIIAEDPETIPWMGATNVAIL